MSFAIVIGSYVGSPWLPECLASMPRDVNVIVVCEPNYECGKIGWAYKNTNLDEFLFLPDTTKVLKHEWIYQMRDHPGSCCVCAEPGPYGSFMGKFRRATLDRLGGVPHTPDKWSAVFAEADFMKAYCAIDEPVLYFPEFKAIGPDGQPKRIEYKHGRDNAVMENEHLIKWKGAWDHVTVGLCEEVDIKNTGR